MKPKDYLALLLLAAIWGASFLFIKIAVGEISPVMLVFGRCLAAAAGLLVVLVISRVPLRTLGSHWKTGLFIAIFNAALPYTLIAFGEQYIDSSLAGILNATAPMWTVLLAPFWAEADRITARTVVGLVIGFAGIVVLARPTGNVFSSSSLGILAVVAATLSYALATHFSKRHFQDTPPQVPAFLQCIGAAVVLAPLALLFRPQHVPPLGTIAAVVWLGLGATGLAMILAFWLIKRVGASRTIVVTYLIPPFALLWGITLLHERIGIEVVIALGLILGGVFLITRPQPARALPTEVEAELPAAV
ncbi:MAG TPA: EamA family transporter [Candidatus Dormibacteraeota bacterium]|nr:EamA family transporter [Candidatus Dormibacteraeota bacterium]